VICYGLKNFVSFNQKICASRKVGVKQSEPVLANTLAHKTFELHSDRTEPIGSKIACALIKSIDEETAVWRFFMRLCAGIENPTVHPHFTMLAEILAIALAQILAQ
jgi:hypothetical protein